MSASKLRVGMLASCCCLFGASLWACGDDAEEVEGSGSVTFTTWGEEYIEQELPSSPPAEEGLVDGWTIKYDKFLIVLEDVVVADANGNEAGRMSGSKMFDMHSPGAKSVTSFESIPAKSWEAVSFVVGPASAATELGEGATQGDLEMMVSGGWSVHVVGSAAREGVVKKFTWSFDEKTLYRDCKTELDGKETHGVTVTQGGSDTIELTIHGDHFFYDDLEAASAQRRFDAIACADTDGDGEVTLTELSAASLLPDASSSEEACRARPAYRPGSQSVNDLEGFVRALSRTLGHYRGEGECISQKLN